MKKDIHPTIIANSVKCVCGTIYDIDSTAELKSLDICSNCHPFYTGKQKIVDTEGRIEKFQKKYAGFGIKKKKS